MDDNRDAAKRTRVADGNDEAAALVAAIQVGSASSFDTGDFGARLTPLVREGSLLQRGSTTLKRQGDASVGAREKFYVTHNYYSKAIAVSLLVAVPIAAGQEKLDYARILRDGCSVYQIDGKAWRAYVWADYREGAGKHDFAL